MGWASTGARLCRRLLRPRQPSLLQSSALHSRMSLKTTRMESEAFRALFTPELKYVRDLFAREGHEMRIAGGAVRDLLMGLAPADVDFATTATPEEMTALFEKNGVRILHKKGEDHGTVTCRIADKENFEITTLRVDKVCDGRRAEVEFTRDWGLDAERRDLTVNSLFLGLDGTVYDYFDGIRHVEERRIAFVRDPVQRIQEDYLRIFRYFRFFGRIAKTDAQHEPETLKAIRENASGIRNVSGERIWSELKRIGVGRMAGPVLRTMISEAGLGEQMALPEEPNLGELDRVWALAEAERSAWEPSTVLASLFREESEVEAFAKRLKISRLERSLLSFVVEHRAKDVPDRRKLLQDLLLDTALVEGMVAIRKARSYSEKRSLGLALYHFGKRKSAEEARRHVLQLLRYDGGQGDLLSHMTSWVPPKFPLNGRDLIEAGVRKGPDVSTAQAHVYAQWKELGYPSDASVLLKGLADVVALNPNPPKLQKIDAP